MRPRAWLPPAAKREFRHFSRLLGPLVASETDRHSLELLACAVADFKELQVDIAEHGRTYTTKSGRSGVKMERPRPQVAMAEAAFRRIALLAPRFGLDAISRERVSRIPASPGLDGPLSDPYFQNDSRGAAWLATYGDERAGGA